MLLQVRGGGTLPLRALALALGIGAFAGTSVKADDGTLGDFHEGRFKHNHLSEGTLGWAEYGLYPGLYGFSLRWHLGYGYGRYALGVGADGGYPFYGGPGYPHEWPRLRRFGPATPFAYYGGPDHPREGDCNYYTGIGGLVIEKPVVTIGAPGDLGYDNENGDVTPGTSFGAYTGAIPYPETFFAPYASAAATTGSSGAEGPARPLTGPPNPRAAGAGPAAALSPATGEGAALQGPGRYLGIDEVPVADPSGVRGIQVTKVYAGSPAGMAGLRAGDVIHSVNGYPTRERGNLAWIINIGTRNDVLTMNVRSVVDGKEHAISINLPTQPVNTERPSGYWGGSKVENFARRTRDAK
jgi:PDZ domain